MHASEGDAFSALGWGLRRYAWIVLATMVVLGVLVPEVLHRSSADRYDAQAQVGPVTALTIPNLDALPRSGETVFANGAVEDAVRRELRLESTQRVVPDHVELVAPQDNLVFTVIGHGKTAQAAANAANAAAGTFTEELNRYEDPMGTFAVQRSAAVPVRPAATVRWLPLVLAGLAAGVVVGVGIVTLLMAVRRPVLSPTAASRAAGVPVLASVELKKGSREVPGLAQVCHRLLHQDARVVFVTGPDSAAAERRRLVAELFKIFQSLPVRLPNGEPVTHPRIVDDPTTPELATRGEDAFTLIVVPLGAALGAVVRHAEHHVIPGATAVVLVRRTSGLRTSLLRLSGVGALVTRRA